MEICFSGLELNDIEKKRIKNLIKKNILFICLLKDRESFLVENQNEKLAIVCVKKRNEIFVEKILSVL